MSAGFDRRKSLGRSEKAGDVTIPASIAALMTSRSMFARRSAAAGLLHLPHILGIENRAGADQRAVADRISNDLMLSKGCGELSGTYR